MKKKGYFVHFEARKSIGVSKKIDMQMEELQKHFEVQEVQIASMRRNLLKRIWGLLPMVSIERNYEEALAGIEDPDFVYIRRAVADFEYLKFLKKIKERYPNGKIIIEIFTYPYDRDDFGKWNAWPFYFKELMCRPRLKKYVDRFVTYTKDAEIFDVRTICAGNGINVENVNIVKGEYVKDKIILVGVAYMQRQHGYERVIEGLREYYKDGKGDYTVELLLVGEGPEKKKYQRLVERYHLQSYVKFYPTMSGSQLDEVYDRGDIALAVFGMYKVGFFADVSALKTRECLAKGLPMITGSRIDVLGDGYKYVRNFSNDKQSIDIKEVVKFFERIKEEDKDKSTVAENIRSFAFQHVSMRAAMEPIVNYIEGKNIL